MLFTKSILYVFIKINIRIGFKVIKYKILPVVSWCVQFNLFATVNQSFY